MFITGSIYKSIIEEIGAALIPLERYADFTETDLASRWPARYTLPEGPIQLAYDLANCFVNPISSQHNTVQGALRYLKDAYPLRQTVLVAGKFPRLKNSPNYNISQVSIDV